MRELKLSDRIVRLYEQAQEKKFKISATRTLGEFDFRNEFPYEEQQEILRDFKTFNAFKMRVEQLIRLSMRASSENPDPSVFDKLEDVSIVRNQYKKSDIAKLPAYVTELMSFDYEFFVSKERGGEFVGKKSEKDFTPHFFTTLVVGEKINEEFLDTVLVHGIKLACIVVNGRPRAYWKYNDIKKYFPYMYTAYDINSNAQVINKKITLGMFPSKKELNDLVYTDAYGNVTKGKKSIFIASIIQDSCSIVRRIGDYPIKAQGLGTASIIEWNRFVGTTELKRKVSGIQGGLMMTFQDRKDGKGKIHQNFYPREIIWNNEDRFFFDLEFKYSLSDKGKPVRDKNEVLAMNIGDVHVGDEDKLALAGSIQMMRVYKPKYVFLHDLVNNQPVSSHAKGQADILRGRINNKRNLKLELKQTIEVLQEMSDAISVKGIKNLIYIVASNHDLWVERYVTGGINMPSVESLADEMNYADAKEYEFYTQMFTVIRFNHRHNGDPRKLAENFADPVFKELLKAKEEEVKTAKDHEEYKLQERADGTKFREVTAIELALIFANDMKLLPKEVVFLLESDSIRLEEVLQSNHGHRGAKANTDQTIGHWHSPSVTGGVVILGTNSNLKPEYIKSNDTSWYASNCIQHKNGARQTLAVIDGFFGTDQEMNLLKGKKNGK